MANFIRFTGGSADFPSWVASGDFSLTLDFEHTTTDIPTYFLGQSDFAAFQVSNSNGGGLQFRLTPSLVFNVGGAMTQSRYIIELSRTGSEISVVVNGGAPVLKTFSGDVNFSRIGGISSDNTNTLDFYSLIMSAPDAGDRSYIPSPTEIPDEDGGSAATLSGTYTIEEDLSGDTTPPVITRLGDATVTVTNGDTYVDAGFTATDDTDGDITANIVVTNPVDTSVNATYTVRANVTDAAGNSAEEVTRTVIVQEVVADVITVADAPYSNFVAQRGIDGNATISFDVTYTGSPTSLQYRILNSDDSGTVVDWATFDASPSGGAASLNVTVAGSLIEYIVEVRFSNDTGVTASQLSGWYVGDRILIAGQSLAQRLQNTGTEENISGYFKHLSGENVAPSSIAGYGQSILAKDLIGESGVATAILNTAIGGSSLSEESGASVYWDETTGSLWQDTLSEMNTFTDGSNEIAFMWWHQGTSDGVASVSYQDYYSALESFFFKVRNAFNNPSGTLPIICATLGRGSGAGYTDEGHQAVRAAQIDYFINTANFYPIDAFAIELNDGVHGSQSGYASLMHKVAATYFNLTGELSYAPLNLLSSSEVGSTVTLTYDDTLNADTNYSTEGVAVFVDGVEATVSAFTRTGANEAQITLSSALSGGEDVRVVIPYGLGGSNNALTYPRKAPLTLAGGDAFLEARAFDERDAPSLPVGLPLVNAGANIAAESGDTVALSGATASNYDSLQWTCTSGQNPTFSDAATLNPAVTFNESGAHTLRLTATNVDGSDFDELVASVSSATPNQPPTANAGPNQSVAAGATVQLDGTGSTDGDGTIVSYAWSQSGSGDAVILTGATTAAPSFTAPSTNTAQTLTFDLTVTDNEALTATDSVDIDVAAQIIPVTESTINMVLKGIPDGTYKTRVIVPSTSEVFISDTLWKDEIASIDLPGVEVGTAVEYAAHDDSSLAGYQLGVTV